MAELADLTEAIKKGKRKIVLEVVPQLLDAGHGAGEILQAMLDGMEDVGRRFKADEIFVPEVLIAARAMKTGTDLLEPQLAAAGIRPEHKILIGTVKGDLHDIGKNLVGMMLRGANFEVIDLGTDVGPEAFVAALEEHKPHAVALSALLTTTMPAMKETIDAIRAAGIPVKTMIGGAPVTQDFADEIGADGYSADAASAAELAQQLVKA